MRVLLLTQFYPPVIGGEERHVRNLAAALAANGHHAVVATQATPGAARVEQDGAVRVHRLRGTLQRLGGVFSDPARPFAPPAPDPELVLNLRRVVAEERPDIVHAHNWLLHSFLPLKEWSGVPFVVTLHDYSLVCPRKNLMQDGQPCAGAALFKCLSCARQQYPGVKGAVVTLANRLGAARERRLVDKFLAVSSAVARLNGLAQAGVPFEVVPNFVPDDIGALGEADPALLALLPPEYILFVGDLSAQKGIELLLRAYALLRSPPPLVMIGRRLSGVPAALPAGVRVLDPWPHASIMHAWSRCLFGVAPSVWHEPCATVVLEAMGQGKPMVVTTLGGMPDLVADETTGLVVEPQPAALAGAMGRLIDDPALRDQMAIACRARVKTFMAGAVVRRIERIYQTLLAETAQWPMPGTEPAGREPASPGRPA